MGMRLRLDGGFAIPGSWGPQATAIAEALKTYGAIIADNGSNFFISGTREHRWDDDDLSDLKDIPRDAFEVVQSASAEVSPCP